MVLKDFELSKITEGIVELNLARMTENPQRFQLQKLLPNYT